MNNEGFLIKKGDIDGFLGLLVDNLSAFLLLIALNLYVVGMPPEIVFGRILPGAAIGLLGGNIYYVFMARRLAKKEGRDDVTALPCGVSIVFVITYTMGIIFPLSKITGDPELAWKICLGANVIGAVICLIGAFIAPILRKFLPPVSMLGALAGLCAMFIAGAGLKDVFANPVVGFSALCIILWGYVAGGKMPLKLPAGLLALIVGAILAVFMGQTNIQSASIGTYLPFPWIFKLGGDILRECSPYLAIIIPVAVINFISTMNNVESARTAGDNYNIRETMVVDALASFFGAVFGCCYPNCVFIGHPAYKRMGARQIYSLLNSVVLTLLAIFGMFGLINSVIPIAAVAPILIYIGMVNVEVAFTEVPKHHIPAAVLALLPFVSEFGKEQVDMALQAAGSAMPVGGEMIAKLSAQGVNYMGMSALTYGTILIAMILSALLVFVIERQMQKAAIVALTGMIFSFVGLIHAPQLMFNANPTLTMAWGIVALLTFGAFMAGVKPQKTELQESAKA